MSDRRCTCGQPADDQCECCRDLRDGKSPEQSISDLLSEFGITHARDKNSTSDGAHQLFISGVPVGRYTAAEATRLLVALRALESSPAAMLDESRAPVTSPGQT